VLLLDDELDVDVAVELHGDGAADIDGDA